MAAPALNSIRRKFPIHPAHPERNCWGCDRYCASNAMLCGNGSERTQHPLELFGEDWLETGLDGSLAGGQNTGEDRIPMIVRAPDRVGTRDFEGHA